MKRKKTLMENVQLKCDELGIRGRKQCAARILHRVRSRKQPLKANVSRGAALVQTSVKEYVRARREHRDPQRDLVPVQPAARKCAPPARHEDRKLRSCHVELVFPLLGSKRHGPAPAGPSLRFCLRPGEPGVVVRVGSPEASLKLARRFCECREQGKIATTCAMELFPGGKLGTTAGDGERKVSAPTRSCWRKR